jgi:uncharacterized RDD family membrane protein YckC
MSIGALMIPLAVINTTVDFSKTAVYAIGSLQIVIFLLKDNYSKEGSLGKKLTGIKIVFDPDVNLHRVFVLKAVRNISLFLWPIELLIMLVNKGKRLGDMLVKSRVELK